MRICYFKENLIKFEEEVTTENTIPSRKQIMDQPDPEESHELHSDQFHSAGEDVDVSDGNLTPYRNLSVSEEQKSCLTVQPNRILCGVSIQD